MHFAPQWVKPIKPTGTSLTPTSDTSSATTKTSNSLVSSLNIPFPVLSQAQRAESPTTTSGVREPPLSYSRVTHTPVSPSLNGDSSYFAYPEGDSNAIGNLHPFRYSREQILALWDEDQVKQTPIELMEMLDTGGELVSKSVVRPVGLRGMTEEEKKVRFSSTVSALLDVTPRQLFATSIHPPVLTRRPMPPHTSVANEIPATNGAPSRRPFGAPGSSRDPSATLVNGRAPGFGGFGRGEGGALGGGVVGKSATSGGGMMSPGGSEGRAPGVLGGGFGGVAKRLGRGRTESGDAAGESPP